MDEVAIYEHRVGVSIGALHDVAVPDFLKNCPRFQQALVWAVLKKRNRPGLIGTVSSQGLVMGRQVKSDTKGSKMRNIDAVINKINNYF